jgi:hypothetical protein
MADLELIAAALGLCKSNLADGTTVFYRRAYRDFNALLVLKDKYVHTFSKVFLVEIESGTRIGVRRDNDNDIFDVEYSWTRRVKILQRLIGTLEQLVYLERNI